MIKSEINNDNKFEDYFEHMKIRRGDEVRFTESCDVEMFYGEFHLEKGEGEIETIEAGEYCKVESDNGEYVDLLFSDDNIAKHVSKLILKRIR